MLRKKQPALVITFQQTTQAMAAERFCMEQNLPGRLIPVPREITAGCGLAWKAPAEAAQSLPDALTAGGIAWQDCRILVL